MQCYLVYFVHVSHLAEVVEQEADQGEGGEQEERHGDADDVPVGDQVRGREVVFADGVGDEHDALGQPVPAVVTLRLPGDGHLHLGLLQQGGEVLAVAGLYEHDRDAGVAHVNRPQLFILSVVVNNNATNITH